MKLAILVARNMPKQLELEHVLRIGIFLTFIGHGVFALGIKHEWIPFLTAVGFSQSSAIEIMPFIGLLDIFVAWMALLYPVRIIIIWAFLWALATAIMRPVTGYEIWDFVERGANWALPLALILKQGFPRSLRDWFTFN
jgi:hypothetical protein